ncbi:sialate O-acetylesterase [Blautia sp. AF13-16]|jgi:acyl-CoA thioesterase-1|nr:sialate O-acetylesterase [Blautia producta]RHP76839.1 sialate O-acetylesterase [Blautia sp. OF01-4LB]RHS14411.1 sialate O-acetylesterase [Blautia sp. AF13-16]
MKKGENSFMRQKKLSDYLLRFAVLLAVILLVLRLTCPSQTRIACVGDSITYGATIRDKSHDSYPAQLGTMLGRKYSVKNFGASGYTLQESCDRPYTSHKRYKKSLDFKPDVVLIMLGTNDTKPYNWISTEAFQDDYRQLILSYQELPSRPDVILMTPASVFPENFNPAKPYKIRAGVAGEAAKAVRELAKELGLPFIDIHEVTASHPEFFLQDGVHPNELGAKAIARTVYEALKDWGY